MRRICKKILCTALFLLVLFLPFSYAATLSGIVYDNNLDALTDAVITINTLPKQQYVAKDSTYTFKLSPGTYTLTITYQNNYGFQSSAQENVTIQQEGDFTYDIIVFTDPGLDETAPFEEPATTEDISLLEQTFPSKAPFPSLFFIIVLVLILIILILLYVLFIHKRKPATKTLLQEDAEEILAYIKSQGGRVTQKMLRQHFPFSEAKVSLIVSELEHKGSLEKIKKGKGNLILLKR